MNQNRLRIWFSVVSIILILFGIFYCFVGLKFFVRLKILPANKDVLLDWESAIYGAIMIGWGATLFLLGGLAFRRQDKELMKILLHGIALWLIVEAISSFYLGIFFNVGVDIAVAVLFAFPIIKAISNLTKKNE
ncbi:MAG TPA: hypothetical protein VIM16_11150 [Mucilaginibacter sp.]|jgi:hypothetical protein